MSTHAALVRVLSDLEEALFAEGFAEVHVTATIPGAVSGAGQVHNSFGFSPTTGSL